MRAGLADKICVITGATSGIGGVAAQALGALNAELFLVGRNEHAGHDLVGRLRGRSPRKRVEFIRTDLSRQSDVRMLAARITQNYERIGVLMNNAGGRFDDYHETSDGMEAFNASCTDGVQPIAEKRLPTPKSA